MQTPRRGFTLIELLIVVAIIAILAAIAVPNFLEAQTRAKVSRAQADMRSIAVAIEAYRIDVNHYPIGYMTLRQGSAAVTATSFLSIPTMSNLLRLSWCFSQMTTPVAYLTSAPKDPFTSGAFKFDRTQVAGKPGGLEFWYDDYSAWPMNPDGVYTRFRNIKNHGFTWSLSSAGPAKQTQQMWYALDDPSTSSDPITVANANDQILFPYDATNGTISVGFVARTARGVYKETYNRN